MNKFHIENYISHLSIDCVIFGYKDKKLRVLASKFKYGKNLWGLPGGYILKTESTNAAAARILKERTGLSNIHLGQFRVFGNEDRIIGSDYKEIIKSALRDFDGYDFDAETIDWITSRFICIGYYALVDINKVHPKAGEFEERLEWINISDLPNMTHDHNEIAAYALEALRENLDKNIIGFNLLPAVFTMKEVKELYEAVYERTYAMNNFQKKILELNVLERLGKKFTGAQNKAPFLYRFKTE